MTQPVKHEIGETMNFLSAKLESAEAFTMLLGHGSDSKTHLLVTLKSEEGAPDIQIMMDMADKAPKEAILKGGNHVTLLAKTLHARLLDPKKITKNGTMIYFSVSTI